MIRFTEAIQLNDGVLYHLELHQERVDRTLREFYGGAIDLSSLRSEIPTHAQRGLYKCRVLYSDRIESVEFTPYAYRSIHTVAVVEVDGLDYRYKYADRTALNRLLERSGCDDLVIVQRGRVTDGFASSLVFESSEGLFTPTDYLLPGTRRRALLESGRVEEREILRSDLGQFERLYFVNAMIDLGDTPPFPVDRLVDL